MTAHWIDANKNDEVKLPVSPHSTASGLLYEWEIPEVGRMDEIIEKIKVAFLRLFLFKSVKISTEDDDLADAEEGDWDIGNASHG